MTANLNLSVIEDGDIIEMHVRYGHLMCTFDIEYVQESIIFKK